MDPTQLGPYKIVRKIGEGGMGAVYEAVEDETGRRVAVKVLAAALSAKGGFRARFEVEIETLRKLDHPNIVRIFAWGEDSGLLFYSMEFVDGANLEDLLSRGRRLGWRQAIQVGIQTSKALKHAHDRGIVHRDVKPANLMMQADGQVKLADFGIAQLFGVSGLTAAGGVVGTASYLSPEQAEGERATARSDLYSLGATLYALLTGRPPFVGKTLQELMRLQRTAAPQPVRLLAPDTPEELEGILSGLLEKDAEKRIPNAQTLTKSLQAVESAIALRTTASDEARAAQTLAGGAEATMAHPAPGSPGSSGTPGTGGTPESSESTQGHKAEPAGSSPDDATRAGIGRGKESAGAGESKPAAWPTDLGARAGDSGMTFITAEQAAELDRQREARQPVTIPIKTIGVVLGLIALGVVCLMVLLPPSADKLYKRITDAANTGDIARLRGAADDLEKFALLYKDDPRNAKLDVYRRQLGQAAAATHWPAPGHAADLGPESPIQAIARQGRELAQTAPDQALARLESLLALLGDGKDLGPADREALADVKRQVEQLHRQIELDAAGHLALIRKRLARAEELAATDPAAARAVAQAVVDLYADKPWAAEAVGQARKMLEALK